MCLLYPLLEIATPVAEAKQMILLLPLQCRVNIISPGRTHCLSESVRTTYSILPLQHSYSVADTAEMGAHSPSTITGHRLVPLI